jgi:integrase
MVKLTQIALKSLVKKPGRHSDGGGLYFRVLGEGKSYWVYRFTVAGRERETSIGPFPELSLAEARERHADLRKRVKVDKIDIIGEKRAAKTTLAIPSVKPSFGQMADLHIETHEGSWRNNKHRRQWVKGLGEYAGPIRDKPVDEIKTSDVLAVLRPIWNDIPETASRLRGRIEVVLDAARALGHIPEDRANVARWKGHLDHLLPRPGKLTRGHHAAMPYDQLPEFMARLVETPGVAAKALQFLILTATRTSETLGAQWDEISFQTETWVIPKERMKMDEVFSVPLSDAALHLLGDQMGHRGKSTYIFGGRPRAPLSNMSLSMLLRRMGIDATVHGFRTSFRTWCSDIAHVEFEVAESCLSHRVGTAVSRAYARSDMLERRRPIMESWSRYIEGKADANVVSIRKPRIRAPYRRA